MSALENAFNFTTKTSGALVAKRPRKALPKSIEKATRSKSDLFNLQNEMPADFCSRLLLQRKADTCPIHLNSEPSAAAAKIVCSKTAS